MDVVRAFHRAMNDADVDALAALLHPQCVVEYAWTDSRDVIEGRDAVRDRWIAEFARFKGALPGGHRMTVSRIAGIETGWGWVRSEWVQVVEGAHSTVGYSHFWIEDSLIRRHRSIAKHADVLPGGVTRLSSDRKYPTKPLVGVGAAVMSDAGHVLLVKRRHEPLAGQWSLPGGMLEIGETLEAGVAREIEEESGLIVDVGPVIEAFDRILLDDAGKVRYHFVLIDYLCRVRGGTLRAGSDVDAVEFADPAALEPYRLTGKNHDVIAKAVTYNRTHE
jgi:ADP-ribose pyrophosphatase YjhB (NUDIX family)